MTSEKYFSKWVREAGRGHIAAGLSWGSLFIYGLLTAAQLGFHSDFQFFGIGSRELLWICAGLGAALSFLEFFYLLQPKKLDFYYSLPVRKSTVFWGRYVHGLVHFLIPLCLTVTACGLYESSFDADFFPYSASYTGHSILVFAGIFLIFYHLGILLLVVCGSVLPAVLGYALCLCYGQILVGNAWTVWAEHDFRTYYRIPVLERLDVLLAPVSLAGELAGSSRFDKLEVFQYVPSGDAVLAASGWILLSLLLFAAAQARRKTERVGKWFAIPLAERAAECLLSFLAGVWCGSFLTALTGLAEQSPGAGGAVSLLAGVAAAAGVHILLELGVGCGRGVYPAAAGCGRQTKGAPENAVPKEDADLPAADQALPGRGVFRRKWQLAAECAAVVLSGMVFLLGAPAFDSFQPKESEVDKIRVSIDGLGMNQASYAQVSQTGDRQFTDWQMEEYVLAEEGKSAALAWSLSLAKESAPEKSEPEESASEESAPEEGEPEENEPAGSGAISEVTHAVLCYQMKNGSEIYRLYPVSEEDLQAFSMVYETEEYKRIAYPVPDSGHAADARFSWSDRVTDTAMKLEEREKEALLEACREDIMAMKMSDLREALPLGFVEVDSEMPMVSGTVPVYPFFTRTCSLLEAYGVQIHRTLADYNVRSVSVSTRSEHGRGKRISDYYEDPEQVAGWIRKAVPEDLDLQPLLHPLDYSKEIRAEVVDETTNSVIHVDCYPRRE